MLSSRDTTRKNFLSEGFGWDLKCQVNPDSTCTSNKQHLHSKYHEEGIAVLSFQTPLSFWRHLPPLACAGSLHFIVGCPVRVLQASCGFMVFLYLEKLSFSVAYNQLLVVCMYLKVPRLRLSQGMLNWTVFPGGSFNPPSHDAILLLPSGKGSTLFPGFCTSRELAMLASLLHHSIFIAYRTAPVSSQKAVKRGDGWSPNDKLTNKGGMLFDVVCVNSAIQCKRWQGRLGPLRNIDGAKKHSSFLIN